MCGLAGIISKNPVTEEAGTQLLHSLRARGPDGQGTYRISDSALLVHTRLAILDTSSKGQQPMVQTIRGNKLAIVFNGLIYNYDLIRNELIQLGSTFDTQTDTEVILKAYHAWGIDCVKQFNGMFAFAIHERDSGRVILARDRLGIKPLYYSQVADRLRFASSLPALLAAVAILVGL